MNRITTLDVLYSFCLFVLLFRKSAATAAAVVVVVAVVVLVAVAVAEVLVVVVVVAVVVDQFASGRTYKGEWLNGKQHGHFERFP